MPDDESKSSDLTDVARALAPLKPAEVEERVREFLETWPLYRRLNLRLPEPATYVDFPNAISLPCDRPKCKNEPATTWQRFEMREFYPGQLVNYKCIHCGGAVRAFWVVQSGSDPIKDHLGEISAWRSFAIQKIGQWPSWSIEPPKEVQRALDPENLELYKKGLVCMSQSYGIGAVGYFRRVVENAVGSLLDLVEEAAKGEGDEAALKAVQEARGQKQADQKLKLAAAAVPASLRPGGVNPLGTLYADYSRDSTS